jgi:4-alpha-glucanotransferase
LGGDSEHLPHNFAADCVGYTGTHDNNTTLGYFGELEKNTRDYALRYLGYFGSDWSKGGRDCHSVRAAIKTLISSVCRFVIIPLQDLCGFGEDTRMNIPGTVGGINWRFRTTWELMRDCIDKEFMLSLNGLYGRNKDV